MVETDDGPGLLDLKGVGVPSWERPAFVSHRTGLCLLAELLRSVLFQAMLGQIFRAAGRPHICVPFYGVLDAGFDGSHPELDGPRPVGILVRRAHRRPRDGIDLPFSGSSDQERRLEVEMLLRSYGLTSCNRFTELSVVGDADRPHFMYCDRRLTGLSVHEEAMLLSWMGPPPVAYEGVNVQTTRGAYGPEEAAQLVDIGQYEWRPRFSLGVASLVRDRPLWFGGALRPDDPEYVQPDPRLHLPSPLWAPDRLLAWLDALVFEWRSGALDEAGVLSSLEERIALSVAGWDTS